MIWKSIFSQQELFNIREINIFSSLGSFDNTFQASVLKKFKLLPNLSRVVT